MSNEIKKEGVIIAIDEIITFDSGFTKREFVIKTTDDGDYPQDIKFELVKDKTALIDKYNVGDKVTVYLNIRGREYNERYFVNLVAWKIEGQSVSAAPTTEPDSNIENDDKIPF